MATTPSQPDPAPENAKLAIKDNRLFQGLPPETLAGISAELELRRYERDQRIFEEGESGDCLYLVCTGSVRISKAGRGGQQETLGFIPPGSFFGEMALIDGQPRSARAEAMDATTLARVDQAAFERIMSHAPKTLHMNFLRSVVERLRGVNSHYISELMRTERLSLVGSMANSIVHDLRNPLQAIKGCAELITHRSADPSIGKFVSMINRAADNMCDMVQEMLDFARGQTSIQLKQVPLSRVLAELEAQMMQVIPPSIHVVRELEASCEIMADQGRFARMLVNIVKNAVEAMAKGGILTLRTRVVDHSVVLEIGDTGCGMSSELQAKIFEPFVTFGKSTGTGLGMAIAKGVVEAHAGKIELFSELTVGTTVRVSIPTADEARLRPVTESKPSPGGRRIVLVVEDEEVLREHATELLRARGYEVITASTGAECVEKFRQIGPENIALVVMDYLMPEMDGIEAFWHIRAMHAPVRVLFNSASLNSAQVQCLVQEGMQGTIPKPYTAEEYVQKVDEALAKNVA